MFDILELTRALLEAAVLLRVVDRVSLKPGRDMLKSKVILGSPEEIAECLELCQKCLDSVSAGVSGFDYLKDRLTQFQVTPGVARRTDRGN